MLQRRRELEEKEREKRERQQRQRLLSLLPLSPSSSPSSPRGDRGFLRPFRRVIEIVTVPCVALASRLPPFSRRQQQQQGTARAHDEGNETGLRHRPRSSQEIEPAAAAPNAPLRSHPLFLSSVSSSSSSFSSVMMTRSRARALAAAV